MRHRFSDEDGYPAGARNWGRFALALIPLVLGLAAAVWLGFYIGAHRLNKQILQEARAATAVGAPLRSVSRIKIVLGPQDYCAGITRADVDGKTLRMYATNDCNKPLTDMDWHYELLSPDGTILYQDFTDQQSRCSDCSTPRLVGDKAECVVSDSHYGCSGIPIDTRVAAIRLWTVPYSK